MLFAVMVAGGGTDCGGVAVFWAGTDAALLCSAFTGTAGAAGTVSRGSGGDSAGGFGLSGAPPSRVGSTRKGVRLSAAPDEPQTAASANQLMVLTPRLSHAKDIVAAFPLYLPETEVRPGRRLSQ